jgi:hypothetical protein
MHSYRSAWHHVHLLGQVAVTLGVKALTQAKFKRNYTFENDDAKYSRSAKRIDLKTSLSLFRATSI